MKGFVFFTLLLLMAAFVGASEAPSPFPLAQVRLLESPFKAAQDRDLAYLMSLQPERLLAPFLREAGLEPESSPYGNWESSGLDGHIGGHYLTALSLAFASTGEQKYRTRLDQVIGQLYAAQKANGNGYLGGVPGGDTMWQRVAKGEIEADLFSLNQKWVPWYNLHKTYAGLRDAYLLGGNAQALEMLKKLGEWTLSLTQQLSESQIQAMLYTEHGGMNEVFADYYTITGNKKYLALAYAFSEKRILNPLLRHEDALSGLHANTQIPKAVGFARIAQANDDRELRDAAVFFWNTVVKERSVAIGGNSTREHFHDKHDFSSMIDEVQGPETCNTYNMLKLTALLYEMGGEREFVEFYERALYNHILSSQHPDTGGLVYFTPMRPQHYRVYSQVDTAMWCCVGSGLENHLKYGEFIYAQQGDALFVNLFIPSRLEWTEKNVILRQENRIPDEERTRLVFEKGGNLTLNIRIPGWTEGVPEVRINGKRVEVSSSDGYVTITREWRDGDTVTIELPMQTRVEQLPDGSPYFAVLHGPVVLSAPVDPRPNENLQFFADDSRMGHVASGALCPTYDAPMFVTENRDIVEKFKRVPGDKLRFEAPELIGNTLAPLELVPFFRVHDTRYMLYWQLTSKSELKAIKSAQKADETARMKLAEQTVDWVAVGQQQPEAEHDFKGKGTEAGVHRGRHWRHASGWFSYALTNPNGEAQQLRLTLSKEDSGRRFKILLNGYVIDTYTTKHYDAPGFYQLNYPIPETIRDNPVIEFRIEALPNSMAGGLYEVRLLKGQGK